jgi:hypothetical protein
MIPQIPKTLADVPATENLGDALARALIHFLDRADGRALGAFNQRLLDEARDGSGTSPRCPQGALILAVRLADAVEYVAEGATRAGDLDVVEREKELRANPDDYEDDDDNCLSLARAVRDECTKLRDATRYATNEARANVPCD